MLVTHVVLIANRFRKNIKKQKWHSWKAPANFYRFEMSRVEGHLLMQMIELHVLYCYSNAFIRDALEIAIA